MSTQSRVSFPLKSPPVSFHAVQKDIRNCHKKFSVDGPVDGISLEQEIKRIGEALQAAKELVAADTDTKQRWQALDSDLGVLTTRFQMAVRKGLAIVPTSAKPSAPKPDPVIKALNMRDMGKAFPLLLDGITRDNVNRTIYVVGGTTHTFAAPDAETAFSTTTLAHIITKNTLHFSSTQIVALVQKLFDKEADFTARDRDQLTPAHLLVTLGGKEPDYDPFLLRLIREHREGAAALFERSVGDLLMFGKEDIVVALLAFPAKVSEDHLSTACSHFGKTATERPAGVRCVEMLRVALLRQNKAITAPTLRDALETLTEEVERVGRAKGKAMKDFKLRAWETWADSNGKEVERVRKALQMEPGDFRTFCKTAFLSNTLDGDDAHERLLHTYAVEKCFAMDPLNSRKKYEFAVSGPGKAKIAELTALFQQDLAAHAKS